MSSVHITLPSRDLFQFPPSNDPQTLPPPAPGSTLFAPPFSIPASIYNGALDVKVPVTIACVYAVTVTALNKYNWSRGNKPWAISKTKPFFWFVVAHNIFLAVYSAWTFIGMFGALQRTLPRWTGLESIPGTVDSLCKMHGSHGLGNAVAYNGSISQWVSESSSVLLGEMGTPGSTDVGRLWNEGLAFYGWFFYLSKFYEVLDTAIILAKGKRSSTLQTYHHAGAMMCMWSGIRFMSPPIWMFVFVNSAIHALMYTYYTLTAFAVPIPQSLKRSLTTMQIIQFLVGSTYASLHSFVSYTIPVQVPDVEAALKTATTAATVAASSFAASATSAGLGKMVMKYLFRAAGEEGLAENVNGPAPTARATSSSTGIQYRIDYQTVSCIGTSGQTFAIWLNVFYLTPLTFLFVRFFVKSYLRRSNQQGVKVSKHGVADSAGKDPFKGVQREAHQNGSPNGKLNGRVNGKANGYANGKANGSPNGKANGKH